MSNLSGLFQAARWLQPGAQTPGPHLAETAAPTPAWPGFLLAALISSIVRGACFRSLQEGSDSTPAQTIASRLQFRLLDETAPGARSLECDKKIPSPPRRRCRIHRRDRDPT